MNCRTVPEKVIEIVLVRSGFMTKNRLGEISSLALRAPDGSEVLPFDTKEIFSRYDTNEREW